MLPTTAVIAIGSNRRHGRHGSPAAVVRAAISTLATADPRLTVDAVSRLRITDPVGPRQRRFVNAAVRATWRGIRPSVLLATLLAIEFDFGRVRRRRWGPRVLDLDLLTFGAWVAPAPLRAHRERAALVVPHPRLHRRRFALDPLSDVAPGWHHPILHLTARQLRARSRRPRPID